MNLLVYLVGRACGADFAFTQGSQPAQVDAATVAGFTAARSAAGLAVVALLGARWKWVTPLASVMSPSLAILTIGAMTLPVDLATIARSASPPATWPWHRSA